MKKLKLDAFRIAKLSNPREIFGGNGTTNTLIGDDGTDTKVTKTDGGSSAFCDPDDKD